MKVVTDLLSVFTWWINPVFMCCFRRLALLAHVRWSVAILVVLYFVSQPCAQLYVA